MTTGFEVIKFESKVNEIVQVARDFVIQNQSTFAAAGEFRQGIKALTKTIKEDADPIIEKAHALHKELTTKRKTLIDPLMEADTIILGKRGEWTLKLQQIAREEAAIIQAAAEKARAKALAEAQKKIDKLMAATAPDAERLQDLNSALYLTDCTPEDAEMLRRQISILEAKIEQAKQRAATIEAQAQTAAIPTIVHVDNAPLNGKVKFVRCIQGYTSYNSAIDFLAKNYPACLEIDEAALTKLLNANPNLNPPGIEIGLKARETVKNV